MYIWKLSTQKCLDKKTKTKKPYVAQGKGTGREKD